MAVEKKRYWIKLDKNFLKSSQMKVVKSMPNGKDYIIFYLSLMLESVETVGHLRFTALVPYNAEMLSAITDTNIDIVKSAIQIFCELGLMQIFDDGTIFLPQVPEMTGKESESAERVRSYRQRIKEKEKTLALQCNGDVTKSNDNKEKDKEKDKQRIETIKEIVEYLNLKINSKYRHTTKSTKDSIIARLNEGFTFEDFKTVIDNQYTKWHGTEWEQYLRPQTLFGTKFESYLNAPVVKTTKKDSNANIDWNEWDKKNNSGSKYTEEELNKLIENGDIF